MRGMKWLACIVGALMLNGVVVAAELPDYYPEGEIPTVGLVEDMHEDGVGIVINDGYYRLSDNVIVHSMTAYSVPKSHLRRGTLVGFKTTADGRSIVKIWLLPKNYLTDGPRRGRTR